jgi:hypothetical protein
MAMTAVEHITQIQTPESPEISHEIREYVATFTRYSWFYMLLNTFLVVMGFASLANNEHIGWFVTLVLAPRVLGVLVLCFIYFGIQLDTTEKKGVWNTMTANLMLWDLNIVVLVFKIVDWADFFANFFGENNFSIRPWVMGIYTVVYLYFLFAIVYDGYVLFWKNRPRGDRSE